MGREPADNKGAGEGQGPRQAGPGAGDARDDAALLEVVRAGAEGLAWGRGARARREAAAAALAVLYARHRDFTLRVVRRFARDEPAALDAVQEAFVALARRPPRVVAGARLTTWLYAVARNAALRAGEKAGRAGSLEGAGKEGAGAGGAQVVEAGAGGIEQRERDARVRAALRALPEPVREVVILRVVEGLSVDEVAAALGVPAGTVKSRLHHGVRALRGRLEGLGEG